MSAETKMEQLRMNHWRGPIEKPCCGVFTFCHLCVIAQQLLLTCTVQGCHLGLGHGGWNLHKHLLTSTRHLVEENR